MAESDGPFSATRDESTEDNDDDWSRRVEMDESQLLFPSGLTNEEHSNRITDDPDEDGILQVGTTSNFTGSTVTNMSSNMPPRDPSGANPSGSLMEATTSTGFGLAPQREEPTLKEKLVERERQRRVETERARLRRQFALSSNGEGNIMDEDGSTGANAALSTRENGSVAGTLGEGSSVDQNEPDDESEDDQKLPYPMERFLQDQGNVNEESPRRLKREDQQQGVVMERFLNEPVVPEHPSNVDRTVSFDMEPSGSSELATQLLDGARTSEEARPSPISIPNSMPSFTNTYDDVRVSVEGVISMASMASVETNASTESQSSSRYNESVVDNRDNDNERAITTEDLENARLASGDLIHQSSLLEIRDHSSELEPDSPSVDRSATSEQPRVLRLTEAEIQEMAAIEEASRSNGPPSERDDISESSFVAEMVTDFGGTMDQAGTLSQGTPTTAMESASLISGNRSPPPSDHDPGDQHSTDGMGTASISSHLMVSSSGGSVSVTANPPSEFAGEERAPSPIPDMIQPVPSDSPGRLDHDSDHHDHHHHSHQSPTMQHEVDESDCPAMPMLVDDGPIDLDEAAAVNAGIVNRRQRPGMVNLRPQTRGISSPVNPPSSPLRRSVSAPDKMHIDVDGFDFDKHAPMSPRSGLSADSLRDLPADEWSPVGKMAVSPLHAGRTLVPIPSPSNFLSHHIESSRAATYGSTSAVMHVTQPDLLGNTALPDLRQIPADDEDHHADENQPLLRNGVPSEIAAPTGKGHFSSLTPLSRVPIGSVVAGDVRSHDSGTINAGQRDAEKYAESSSLAIGECDFVVVGRIAGTVVLPFSFKSFLRDYSL
jgi:hypothetical protein